MYNPIYIVTQIMKTVSLEHGIYEALIRPDNNDNMHLG
jgi:hypothetical protein